MIPCISPCNTPSLPVKKPNGKGWRFLQDFRGVSKIVILNPHTLLSSIPVDWQYFPVIDLCSALFSIPVEKNSLYLFTFTWESHQFTWIIILQAYTENLTYFSQLSKADLNNVEFPRHSTLMQYVDDLLLCSRTLLDS